MTKIGFIRHGSTAWNKEGRAQGNTDIPLDETGINQAEKVADRLSKENWDVIYSSDLLRAKKTAQIIAEKMDGVTVVFDERLREAGGGEIEGTTEIERIEKWGENWRELDLGKETPERLAERGLSILNTIIDNHRGRNILIVSHGAFIRHLFRKIIPHVNVDEALNNTSLTITTLTGEEWDCTLYNCSQHLTIAEQSYGNRT